MRNVQTPATHRNDPASSYDAELHLNKSGERRRQQEIVAELVRQHPNCTSEELADFGPLNRWQIARRLPELVTAGVVEKGGMRKSRKTGRPGVTWHPTNA